MRIEIINLIKEYIEAARNAPTSELFSILMGRAEGALFTNYYTNLLWEEDYDELDNLLRITRKERAI